MQRWDSSAAHETSEARDGYKDRLSRPVVSDEAAMLCLHSMEDGTDSKQQATDGPMAAAGNLSVQRLSDLDEVVWGVVSWAKGGGMGGDRWRNWPQGPRLHPGTSSTAAAAAAAVVAAADACLSVSVLG
jgi:hypothetical protein